MSDLISRQAALAEFVDGRDVYDIMESIESLPSADRQEVESATISNEGITFYYRKTGKWDAYTDCEGKSRRITCNICGWRSHSLCWKDYNYCPNCGAKMGGDTE